MCVIALGWACDWWQLCDQYIQLCICNQCIQLCVCVCVCHQCNGWWEIQSSVMCGVRVNMMERRPLVAVGRKATNQIRDNEAIHFVGIIKNIKVNYTLQFNSLGLVSFWKMFPMLYQGWIYLIKNTVKQQYCEILQFQKCVCYLRRF